MKRLIVNADDYGLTPGVASGIRQAHLKGIVTSTTVMMNSIFIERELALLTDQCPRIGLGVHLVLTAGKPLMPFERLPTLFACSPDGIHFLHDLEGSAGAIDTEEVLIEWQAQIEKFIQVTGRNPDHLDAHHHAMGFSAAFLEVYLQLARMYACPVRLPVLSDRLSDAWKNAGCEIYTLMKDGGIQTTQHLSTRFFGKQVNRKTLDVMVAGLQEGCTEWMCHPAVVDEPLSKVSGYIHARQQELTLLTDPTIREQIACHEGRLITFGDL